MVDYPASNMHISVIVCTHNRCESLAKTLDSLARSIVPDCTAWEILVVDNNSTDQTAATVQRFCRSYPGRFRYIFEGRQGKSFALNAGIAESQSDILAFVDDDIIVERTWLHGVTAPLSDSIWAGSGGPVILQWSCPCPRWLKMDITAAPLVGFNPARKAGEIKESLFGGNMAFRRAIFERYGGFRTDLGPSPNRETPRPNEDTEFVLRVLAAGERLYFEPSAIVFHPVPISRLQKSYFLDWWFDKGRADLRMSGVPAEMKWLVAGVPLRFFRRIIHWTARWAIAIDPAERFSHRTKVQWLLGTVAEARRQRRKGVASPAEPIKSAACIKSS